MANPGRRNFAACVPDVIESCPQTALKPADSVLPAGPPSPPSWIESARQEICGGSAARCLASQVAPRSEAARRERWLLKPRAPYRREMAVGRLAFHKGLLRTKRYRIARRSPGLEPV